MNFAKRTKLIKKRARLTRQRLFFPFALLVLILSFQNCDSFEPTQNSTAPPENDSEKVLFSDNLESTEIIDFFIPQSDSTQLNGTTTIQLSTGTVQRPSEVLCANQNDLEDLKSLLQNSTACEFPGVTDPNALCTLEYVFPYATLTSLNGEALQFGEKSNGCSATIDFCLPLRSTFLALLIETVDNASSGACTD